MATPITHDQVLDAIVAELAALDPKGLIISQPILGIEDGDSPDLYRSDKDEKRVHAWVVYQTKALVKRVGDVDYTLAGSVRIRRADRTWAFLMKLYYQMQTGSAASNSQRQLMTIINTVQNGFFKKPKLGIQNENLRQHNDVQFEAIRPIPAGDLKLHLATGRLDVIVWESIAP